MGSLQFHGPWPVWMLIAIAITLAAVAWWLYRRETRTLPSPDRWLLPTLRSAAILLALLMLIEPSCHRRWQEGEPAALDIVLDLSQSMSIVEPSPATENRSTDNKLFESETQNRSGVRLQRIDQYLLSGTNPQLQQWAESHQVSVRTLVGNDLQRVWQSDLSQTQALPVSVMDWQNLWGSFTALGEGLQPLVSSQPTDNKNAASDKSGNQVVSVPATSNENLTATAKNAERSILIFSDGQNNFGDSSAILSNLKSSGIKLYAVGMGHRREDRDVSLARIIAPQTAYFTDSISGKIIWEDQLETDGDNPTTTMKIHAVRAGDNSDLQNLEPLWEQPVEIDGSGQKETSFSFAVEDLVAKLRASWRDVEYSTLPITFRVTLPSLEKERTDRNNSLDFQVAIGTRRQRVLLIDGRSRWEIRFLRNSLERDPNWQVDSFLWGSTGLMPFSQGSSDAIFPETLDHLLNYDLIVMGEVDPNLLPVHVQTWLQQFVAATGGGLFVVDGTRNYWSSSQLSRLQELLPVKPLGGLVNDGAAMQVNLTDAGQALPVLQIGDSTNEAQSIWNQLPGMKHVAKVEVLPGGETLANLVDAQQQSHPYLVTRLFGSGRVLYAASDESWRWRYVVEDKYHQRFWNQAARWVMRSPFMVQSEWLSLDTGQVFYEPSQTIRLRARLKDMDGKPSTLESIDGLITLSDSSATDSESSSSFQRKVLLLPVAQYPGVYEGQLSSLPPADYSFSVQAPGYQQSVIDLSAKFSVIAQTVNEFSDLTCNEAWLKQICEATGGQYFHETDATELIDLISESSSGKFVESDTLLWQSYLWFIPIVGLLGLEWWRRKQAGLI